jgi:hypothetical protein
LFTQKSPSPFSKGETVPVFAVKVVHIWTVEVEAKSKEAAESIAQAAVQTERHFPAVSVILLNDVVVKTLYVVEEMSLEAKQAKLREELAPIVEEAARVAAKEKKNKKGRKK